MPGREYCEGNAGVSDVNGLCYGMPGMAYNEYDCSRCKWCASYQDNDWYGPEEESPDNYDWDADDDYDDGAEDED